MPFPSDHLMPDFQSLPARSIYFDLCDGPAGQSALDEAAHFLSLQLEKAADLESDLPRAINGLETWMRAGAARVGRQYHEYLKARAGGETRRYFQNKSHALYFLKSVAPTKLVDGTWLYGVLKHWPDARFASLVQTYLEELGEGKPDKNHVVIYKKLLASQGNPHWDDLPDEYYVQGALQLALARHADQFLPEIIGFNLGYEQLPLHLLITAYELKELGINPYYFTLHITVDNADSGHAQSAVRAVFDTMPKTGNREAWQRRVCNGYKLNLLGANTQAAIASFDLERELKLIFSRKAAIGQYAHSDYRRIESRTVNEWLSSPDQIGAFIAALEDSGWFKRHRDPRESRFWKLISGENSKMYGVFNAYEQQVIYDWIAGDAAENFPRDARIASTPRRALSFEDKQRLLHSRGASTHAANEAGDFEAEERALEKRLLASGHVEETMETLIALMAPDKHHSAPGLAATRIFAEVFN